MYSREVLIILAVVIVFFYFTKQMSLENFDVPNEAVGAISDMYNNKKVTTNDLEVTNGITTQNANVTGTLTTDTVSAQSIVFPIRCRTVNANLNSTTPPCGQSEYLNWIWYNNPNDKTSVSATCCRFHPWI